MGNNTTGDEISRTLHHSCQKVQPRPCRLAKGPHYNMSGIRPLPSCGSVEGGTGGAKGGNEETTRM